MPFDDSRRLTGSNLFFDSPGAVLETVGVAVDESCSLAGVAAWRVRETSLSWPDSSAKPLRQPRRAMSSSAPDRSRSAVMPLEPRSRSPRLADQLFTATEINEWAFCAALAETDPVRWSQFGRSAHRGCSRSG